MTKPPFLKILTSAALSLAAMGVNSCQTVEQRMISEISDREANFDAEARYASYVQRCDGEFARQLRKAAADAATMRICISGGLRKMEAEYLPLADDEVADVRKILAEIEEAPPLDFNTWLLERYDSYCGPQPSAPLYWCAMEFVAADGSVLHTFYGFSSEMGDAAKADEYRTKAHCPDLLLPEASRKHWKSLPFHARTKARLRELYKNH